MNKQRMLRVILSGGYSDSMIGEDFDMHIAASHLMENGYLIIANGEGYFPASEIKAMFIYQTADPPQQSGDPNIIIFPKPAA
jgi:hypothetical protein